MQQRGYHSPNVLLAVKQKNSWLELKHCSVNKVSHSPYFKILTLLIQALMHEPMISDQLTSLAALIAHGAWNRSRNIVGLRYIGTQSFYLLLFSTAVHLAQNTQVATAITLRSLHYSF